MAAVLGRMSPRMPLEASIDAPRTRDPSVHRGPGPRDAALLCSAWAFPARRDEALRGALGIGGDGRGRLWRCRSGGVGLLGMDGDRVL